METEVNNLSFFNKLKNKSAKVTNKIISFFNKISTKQKAFLFLGLILVLLVVVLIVAGNKKATYNFLGTISKIDKVAVQKEDASLLNLETSEDSFLINKGGAYYLNGTIEKPIMINCPNEKVYLVLDGFTSQVNDNAAIVCLNAKKLVITVLNENTISSTVTTPDYNGVIYSKCDLVMNGSGSLNLIGTNINGIHASDDLVLYGLTLSITTTTTSGQNAGIKCNDHVTIDEANITISSSGDGIKSGDSSSLNKNAIISICSGTIQIDSKGDSLNAKKRLEIKDGTLTLKASYNSESAKCLKSESLVTIFGGMFNLTATVDKAINSEMVYIEDGSFTINAEKGIASNDELLIKGGSYDIVTSSHGLVAPYVTIDGGTFTIDAENKGMKATEKLIINDGVITISNSYEGLEGPIVIINGGTVKIKSDDDGININCTPHDGMGGMGGSNSEQKSSGKLEINDGFVYVKAAGDGLDSNEKIVINGGIVLVDGPSDSANGALDYDTKCKVRGNAVLIAVGASGMAQAPTSSQGHISTSLSSSASSGTLISITNKNGKLIGAYKATKSFNHIVFATSKLHANSEYTISTGGTIDSEATFMNFYESGTVTGSKKVTTTTATRRSSSSSSMGGGMSDPGSRGGRGFKPLRINTVKEREEEWLLS